MGNNGEVPRTFQIPKASGRTVEVKSQPASVQILALPLSNHHLGFLSCEMGNKNTTYLIGLFCELIENMHKKCLA